MVLKKKINAMQHDQSMDHITRDMQKKEATKMRENGGSNRNVMIKKEINPK